MSDTSLSPSGIVTLLTDFGDRDGYVSAMKGVMLGIHPQAVFVDISHALPPQAIAAAAFLLAQHYRFFPAGTVHLAVVDPGVGTERSPIACIFDGHFFVAPDNGILDFCAEREHTAVELNRPQYWRSPQLSATFHGRDLFAPVAAHLGAGQPIERLGQRTRLARHRARPPRNFAGSQLSGRIEYVDRFGNLISNLSHEDLRNAGIDQTHCRIRIAGREIAGVSYSYGAVAAGELLALIDSFDRLEIGVNRGDAAALLQCGIGEPLRVTE